MDDFYTCLVCFTQWETGSEGGMKKKSTLMTTVNQTSNVWGLNASFKPDSSFFLNDVSSLRGNLLFSSNWPVLLNHIWEIRSVHDFILRSDNHEDIVCLFREERSREAAFHRMMEFVVNVQQNSGRNQWNPSTNQISAWKREALVYGIFEQIFM